MFGQEVYDHSFGTTGHGYQADDDLDNALVVLDAQLDGVAGLRVAVGAAEDEEAVEEHEHILGEVGRRDD